MSRRCDDTDETLARMWTYAAYAEAHPLTSADVDTWLLGLSGLADFEGKIEQLAILEDLLIHADTDDMLDVDKALITRLIPQLHRELDAIPDHLRTRRRYEYCRQVASLNFDDLEDEL